MSVGASLKTVLGSAVAAPNRHHSLFLRHWRAVLGSVVGSLLLCSVANAAPSELSDLPAEAAPAAEVAPPASSTVVDAIADGVYLYGSAPEVETLGAAYMVFAAQDAQLVGAMFMPQSSFDCFQGYRDGNELALQITNSYTQEVYGYAIALVTDEAPIAAVNSADFVLALDGFYNLGTPDEATLAILSTCQANQSPIEIEP